MTGPFATAEELQEYTGVTASGDLARAQSILQMASDLIRGECGQMLSQQDEVDAVIAPTDSVTLVLPERPVTAVTTVKVLGVTVTDYWLDPTNRAMLYRGSMTGTVGMPWVYGATVSYTHGYAESTWQYAELRLMCLEVADRALRSPEAAQSFEPSEETIGWRTRLFLDERQRMRLLAFGAVMVNA